MRAPRTQPDSSTRRRWRRFQSASLRLSILALTAATLAACGGDDPVTPGGDEDGEDSADRTAPTVVSTAPTQGQTAVGTNAVVTATFSEAMDASTINGSTFFLEPEVAGAISYSGVTATLTPAPALSAGTTYTATVTTGARDTAGNPLAESRTWAFTTEAPPVLPAELPLSPGRRWRYEGLDSTVVCASSTGCSKNRFEGEYFLHAEGMESWQGREAWRLLYYRLEAAPGADPGFRATPMYVAQDASGLWQWVHTGSGGVWRQVLSRTSASIDDATFLLIDGPAHGGDIQLEAGTATVPAGSFSTLRAFHEFRETGQYAPEDIFETRIEHFADDVGVVLGTWDYSFDDNDPAGTDIVSEGVIALTHVDTGPFPDFVADSEPNDTTTGAGAASPFAIAAGDTHIDDPGAVLTDAGVGCASECVFPNANGEKKIQDWYAFELTESRAVRIELAFETYTNGQFNDLDLYAFEETGGGPAYIGASTAPEGEQEILAGTLAPGTYYLAVQAWSTPTGRFAYWLSIR